jgi:hypothetical protein
MAAAPPSTLPALNVQHERFAALVAAGESYAASYAATYGYTDIRASAVRTHASRLASSPAVAARIRELQRLAAERAVISIAERMMLLRVIADTSAAEVVRVVTEACPSCWPNYALAAAAARFAAGQRAMPDMSSPQHDCPACRGRGAQRVDITPTDELSAAGRAIYRGAKQNDKGAIEVMLADRQAAIAELNRMQPGALAATKHLNLNANLNIGAARDVSPDEAAALIAALDGTGGAGGDAVQMYEPIVP